MGFISRQGMRVWGFLQRGILEGRSAFSVLKALRKYGLGYRTKVFYSDWNILKRYIPRWENMKNIPRNKRIIERWYAVTKTPISTNFQTYFHILAEDTRTGEIIEREVAVGHDEILSRRELERRAISIAQGTSPHLNILQVYPNKGLRSPSIWG